ncbi:hypothetical protein B296_00031901 [Ensete ventricosum]|uniref:Uncharacterized protein n=1 Tax=Ensete ventricosum TaxID=4639 RepID=A0A426YQJ5_ENSVE|nr:hypothetical protein B296_00031901 [Ensete ventricosum]
MAKPLQGRSTVARAPAEAVGCGQVPCRGGDVKNSGIDIICTAEMENKSQISKATITATLSLSHICYHTFLPCSCHRLAPPQPQPPPTAHRYPSPHKQSPPLLSASAASTTALVLSSFPAAATAHPLRGLPLLCHLPSTPMFLPFLPCRRLLTIVAPICRLQPHSTGAHPCFSHTVLPPLHQPQLHPSCLRLSHYCSPCLILTALFLPPLSTAVFTTPFALLFPFFPAPHLPSLPPVVGHCLLLFPTAVASLLLSRCLLCFAAVAKSFFFPSTHSSAASAYCCCSATMPLSLLSLPPCCRSRLQPCPLHLLPFAATSVAATPHRTPLLAGLPLLLSRRTPLLVGTRCPSLLSASP